MTVQELRNAVKGYREKVKERAGKVVTWGEGGPVGIAFIDSIVRVLEAQEKRIEKLEQKLQK
jgi:hypothetical protein